MDHEYLKNMTDGLDRNALLEDLMLTYGKDVWNYAYFLTRRKDLAEDIAQDVFVKAYNSLYSFRGDSPMKAWLLTITRHATLDYLKSSWVRKVAFLTPWQQQERSVPSAETEWFDSMEKREIWDSVLSLPRKLREALLLYAHHHLSIKEIAELMNLNESTVKSRLFRARAAMNRQISREQRADGRNEP
ncbi:RNA polymerase sigma factor [Cohnella faecalis]|uniref:RNA polymerase sigma factor n=2 Tax=Cohnella faecalis TaxID=2315694 RepID=A0A398CLC2_9BACL|nr:sigma-70 family RNA polymerase sigma factor [Cohnella faecalis]RIE01967.1 sigma-70 family RNA polymerase sigma factor [Cohnella faecalis]RIE04146.1 sigma-70 family RNA polymerase sigma factor [Cohnella faecalis]